MRGWTQSQTWKHPGSVRQVRKTAPQQKVTKATRGEIDASYTEPLLLYTSPESSSIQFVKRRDIIPNAPLVPGKPDTPFHACQHSKRATCSAPTTAGLIVYNGSRWQPSRPRPPQLRLGVSSTSIGCDGPPCSLRRKALTVNGSYVLVLALTCKS